MSDNNKNEKQFEHHPHLEPLVNITPPQPTYPPLPPGYYAQPIPSNDVFQIEMRDEIKDHLLWSFFNTFCCCCLFGFIGLIFSIRTRDMKNTLNLENAKKYSQKSYRNNILFITFLI
jgi:hypothetical protein